MQLNFKNKINFRENVKIIKNLKFEIFLKKILSNLSSQKRIKKY